MTVLFLIRLLDKLDVQLFELFPQFQSLVPYASIHLLCYTLGKEGGGGG